MPHLKWSDQPRKKLRRERLRQKLSLAVLAEQVGCAEAMLSQIETGKKTPGDELAGRLCEVLGLRLILSQTKLVRVR